MWCRPQCAGQSPPRPRCWPSTSSATKLGCATPAVMQTVTFIHSSCVSSRLSGRRGGPAPFDDSDVFMHVTHRLLGSRAVGVTLGGVPLALQDMLTSADAVQTAPPSRPAPGRGVGDCSTALIWDTAAPRHTTAAQRTDRLDAASAAVLHESALFDWTPPQHAKAPVARAAAPGAGKAGKARPEWRDDF